jgi:hypothetical protein
VCFEFERQLFSDYYFFCYNFQITFFFTTLGLNSTCVADLIPIENFNISELTKPQILAFFEVFQTKTISYSSYRTLMPGTH